MISFPLIRPHKAIQPLNLLSVEFDRLVVTPYQFLKELDLSILLLEVDVSLFRLRSGALLLLVKLV